MDAELKAAIERMITAGESEENIGAFIAEHSRRGELDRKALRGSSQSEMVLNSMDDAAKGFFKGVLPGAMGAVLGTIPALVTAATGTLKGGANLLTDPVKTLTDAWEAVKGSPGKGADMLKQALELAKQDPEAFGKQMGELTGGVEAGISLGAVAPIVPGTAGRAIGSTMEAAGTHGKWPIRMMGAHQLGSGNPLGLITMMTPEALTRGGRAIRIGSTPAGAVAGEMPTRFLELQQDINAGAADVLPRIDAIQSELTAARKAAKLPEQIRDVQRQQTQLDRLKKSATPKAAGPDKAALAAEKEVQDVRDAAEKQNAKMAADRKKAAADKAEEVRKAKQAESMKEGTQPKTRYSETVSGTEEGVKKSATTTYEPEAPVGTGDPIMDELLARGMDPSKVKSMSVPKAGDIRAEGSKVTLSQEMRNAAMREEAPPAMPFTDRTDVERAIGRADLAERRMTQGQSPTGVDRRVAQDIETLGDAGSGQMRSGSNLPGAMTPTEMLPGPELGPMEAALSERMPLSPELQTLEGALQPGAGPMSGESELLKAADRVGVSDITRDALNRVNARNVPASRSSRPMSATEGLSVEDAKALGLNPDMRVTGLHPDAIDWLLKQRQLREGAYRTNAGMDSVAQALMDREM